MKGLFPKLWQETNARERARGGQYAVKRLQYCARRVIADYCSSAAEGSNAEQVDIDNTAECYLERRN